MMTNKYNNNNNFDGVIMATNTQGAFCRIHTTAAQVGLDFQADYKLYRGC